MLVADVVEAKLFTYCVDQVGVNILHFVCTAASGGNTYDGADFAPVLSTAISLPYKALLPNVAEYVGTETRSFWPIAGPTNLSRSGAGAGSGVGQVMAKQVSGILTKRTAEAGRRRRGRIYVAFPGENYNDDPGKPSPAYVGLLNALGTALMAPFTLISHVGETATLKLAVWSALAIPNAVQAIRLDAQEKWGNQRRRGSYGRPNIRP